jgi:hypothetical protein
VSIVQPATKKTRETGGEVVRHVVPRARGWKNGVEHTREVGHNELLDILLCQWHLNLRSDKSHDTDPNEEPLVLDQKPGKVQSASESRAWRLRGLLAIMLVVIGHAEQPAISSRAVTTRVDDTSARHIRRHHGVNCDLGDVPNILQSWIGGQWAELRSQKRSSEALMTSQLGSNGDFR